MLSYSLLDCYADLASNYIQNSVQCSALKQNKSRLWGLKQQVVDRVERTRCCLGNFGAELQPEQILSVWNCHVTAINQVHFLVHNFRVERVEDKATGKKNHTVCLSLHEIQAVLFLQNVCTHFLCQPECVLMHLFTTKSSLSRNYFSFSKNRLQLHLYSCFATVLFLKQRATLIVMST